MKHHKKNTTLVKTRDNQNRKDFWFLVSHKEFFGKLKKISNARKFLIFGVPKTEMFLSIIF